MQHLAPVELRIALRQLILPRRAHRVVCRKIRILQQRLQNLVRAVPAVHRIDHRLHNAHRAVVSPRIGPHLEVVRVVDVPVRLQSRLVQSASRDARPCQLCSSRRQNPDPPASHRQGSRSESPASPLCRRSCPQPASSDRRPGSTASGSRCRCRPPSCLHCPAPD